MHSPLEAAVGTKGLSTLHNGRPPTPSPSQNPTLHPFTSQDGYGKRSKERGITERD